MSEILKMQIKDDDELFCWNLDRMATENGQLDFSCAVTVVNNDRTDDGSAM